MTPSWTVAEAAAHLDPPMTVPEVRALILAARLEPVGTRQGGRGRPAPTYATADLMRAHARIADFLARSSRSEQFRD